MSTLLFIAQLLLTAVFLIAGLAKLVDRVGSHQVLVDFGVPSALARPLGLLLPLGEVAIAAALIPVPTAWWGALGALTLLLIFMAGISANLARGRTPDCHCFGQLHSAPAGWRTLARNGMLALIAGFVVWQGPQYASLSAVRWVGELTAAQLVGSILAIVVLGLLAAEGWYLLHLLGQQGRLLLRIEALEARLLAVGVPTLSTPGESISGLPISTRAPAFQLPTLDGGMVTLDALRAAGRPVMLVFLDPGCGPCAALLPDLARWQHDHGNRLTIALISRETPAAYGAKSAEYGSMQVLLQQGGKVAKAYQVTDTPSAVIVRPDGTIGSSIAAGAKAIEYLMAQVLSSPRIAPTPIPLVAGRSNGSNGHDVARPSTALTIGQPAPPFRFPDLTGKQIELADFRGSSTLVLFWNPDCGFCARMLDDLKHWESQALAGAPKLLVVSTGSAEKNQAMGLHSPVLLDQSFAAGRAFGADGTPMAVLIDSDGLIASPMIAGAAAILALAAGQNHIKLEID
jgi:peroxiredoxin